MQRDAESARRGLPFVFTDLRHGAGLDPVVAFVERAALLDGEA
jgi:Ni2+-binding GTPase involved in maturation of urease and hydrogenase